MSWNIIYLFYCVLLDLEIVKENAAANKILKCLVRLLLSVLQKILYKYLHYMYCIYVYITLINDGSYYTMSRHVICILSFSLSLTLSVYLFLYPLLLLFLSLSLSFSFAWLGMGMRLEIKKISPSSSPLTYEKIGKVLYYFILIIDISNTCQLICALAKQNTSCDLEVVPLIGNIYENIFHIQRSVSYTQETIIISWALGTCIYKLL